MAVQQSPPFPLKCSYLECFSHLQDFVRSLNSKPIVRYGTYRRISDLKREGRYKCNTCSRTFSASRLTPEFGQKKRHKNELIRLKLASGMSQRRVAKLEHVHLDTVGRRVDFFGQIATLKLKQELERLQLSGELIKEIDFDEMESSIHTKLKPVSMPIVVQARVRKILGLQVAEMPANGLLAEASRKKYGVRKDERKEKAQQLLTQLSPSLVKEVSILTDKKPAYRTWIKEVLPNSKHTQTKGARGMVVGQGELKRLGFDPLFSFNHTAAMFRANVNRLFRRTWCTSKRIDRLYSHMMLYAQYHNEVLVPEAEERLRKRQLKQSPLAA